MIPDIQGGNGAWKLLGLLDGNPVSVISASEIGTAPEAPNLLYVTQLFVRTAVSYTHLTLPTIYSV